MAKTTNERSGRGNSRSTSSRTGSSAQRSSNGSQGGGRNGSRSGGSSSSGRSQEGRDERAGSRSQGRQGGRDEQRGRAQGTYGRDERSGQGRSSRGNDRSEGLGKLFNHQLADMYYVEKQLLKALRKMADKAHSDELAHAFEDHLMETEGHVERVEEAFELLGRTARAKKCDAMDGILDEAKELMDEFKDDPALDAALIAAAQKVEHYEITTYGTLCAWAEELGLDDVAALLEENLEEEEAADEKLTQLAEEGLNAAGDQDADDRRKDEEEEEGTNGRGTGRMAMAH